MRLMMKIIWKMNYCNFSKVFQARPPRTKMSWSGYRVIKQWSVRQNQDIFTTSLTNKDFQITYPWFQNFLNCTCHILPFVWMYTGCRICSLSHPITAQTTSREREKFSQIISHTRSGLLFPWRNKKRIHY